MVEPTIFFSLPFVLLFVICWLYLRPQSVNSWNGCKIWMCPQFGRVGSKLVQASLFTGHCCWYFIGWNWRRFQTLVVCCLLMNEGEQMTQVWKAMHNGAGPNTLLVCFQIIFIKISEVKHKTPGKHYTVYGLGWGTWLDRGVHTLALFAHRTSTPKGH